MSKYLLIFPTVLYFALEQNIEWFGEPKWMNNGLIEWIGSGEIPNSLCLD